MRCGGSYLLVKYQPQSVKIAPIMRSNFNIKHTFTTRTLTYAPTFVAVQEHLMCRKATYRTLNYRHFYSLLNCFSAAANQPERFIYGFVVLLFFQDIVLFGFAKFCHDSI